MSNIADLCQTLAIFLLLLGGRILLADLKTIRAGLTDIEHCLAIVLADMQARQAAAPSDGQGGAPDA